MALRTDRPTAGGDDGVAVHVARSLTEARKARDGLSAAGVAVELPDAALEAIFATPGATITIKVKGKDLSRALDVVEELFPREVIDLPPMPEPAPRPGPTTGSGASASDAPEPDLDAASARAQGPKLVRTMNKLLGIAGAAVVLPFAGLALGPLAIAGAVWALGRASSLPDARDAVRARALIALVLGALGLAGNVYLVRGWLAGG